NSIILSGLTSGDTIIGSSQADFIDGNYGHDVVSGGAGDDVIIGGPGLDILSGGEGDDTFRYTSGIKEAPLGETLDGGAGTDQVQCYGGTSLHLDMLTLTSVERL